MLTNQKKALETFQRNGFTLVKHAVSAQTVAEVTGTIELARADEKASSPGLRHLLRKSETIRRFAKSEAIHQIASEILGSGARPVKAILFDKTPGANWYVTWHQDLTIALKERIDVPGFGPWSVKDGVPHVQPPIRILEKMVALRIHLDPCSKDNGAIKFIAGSHKVGVLSPEEIARWRSEHTEVCCAAERGDVIAMCPLILHSSSQSVQPDHRRVLHIEYAAEDLPAGLEWAEASGLDSVELVLAIEEEFGVDIPDRHAERIYTVGDMYEYLRSRLSETAAAECLSQKIFYQLRRALIDNYNLPRRSITLDTKMGDLLSQTEIEEGWPYMQLFIDLQTPYFKEANQFFGFKLGDHHLTMRDMVSSLIALNVTKLIPENSTDAELWRRLVDVIVRQVNVSREDVKPEASFTRDLGVC